MQPITRCNVSSQNSFYRAMLTHSVCPSVCLSHSPLMIQHKWTQPALTTASKLVLDLPTPKGWKAELTKATRQCTGRESNLRSLDHQSDAVTTTLPSNGVAVSEFEWTLGLCLQALSSITRNISKAYTLYFIYCTLCVVVFFFYWL